ncbi:MAG: M20/M25/M40 family metallo-hydrolase [Clostridia bacterium]|nr:M20/M25/M40 family metallo-hydrolase [Clostridia bacterium]
MSEYVNVERYRDTLSKAIQCRTVSHLDESQTDWAEFDKLHALFEAAYPLVHKTLKKEVIGKAGLLYTWQGTDPSLKPIALLGHQDVVPVPEETEGDWTYPPFSGAIADGCLWGRGAVDMKDHVVAVLESVETLLEEGYVPTRTVLLLFGYNEELVNNEDAAAVLLANTLKERGIRLESVLDEGGGVPYLRIPGVIRKDLSIVGIAEKGYSDFKLTVESAGGHSASPPAHTAVGILAKAVTRVEKHPFPAKMTPQIDMLLDKLFVSLDFPTRILGKGLDLIRPALRPVLALIPPTASMMHTTTSVTMASGSPQANVLPQVATATINVRILPGQTMDDVKRHLERVIRDRRVKVECVGGSDPAPMSATDTPTFRAIDEITTELFEKSVTVPFMVMGATDARHYRIVCDQLYRYSPFNIPPNIFLLFHSTNERITLDSMEKAVAFFKKYIKTLT